MCCVRARVCSECVMRNLGGTSASPGTPGDMGWPHGNLGHRPTNHSILATVKIKERLPLSDLQFIEPSRKKRISSMDNGRLMSQYLLDIKRI